MSETARVHTLECRCCEQRKPRDGFKLLAGRHVSICPECLKQIEPYLEGLQDLRSRIDEQATLFVVGMLRQATSTGRKPPEPDVVAEHIEGLSPLAACG